MFHEIDDKLRFLVIYQDVTTCVPSIHHYIGIPQRTLWNWVEITKAGENILESKPGKGRKNKINEDLMEEISTIVETNPYKASLRTLAPNYDTSHTTIATALHKKDLIISKLRRSP